MKTKNEYIELIENQEDELRKNFGIRSLRLFGSVSRDEQIEGSDVDVCVEMEPQAYLIVRLKRFLERLLGCPVDVVRMHKHMNPYLLQEINDVIVEQNLVFSIPLHTEIQCLSKY